MEGVEPDFRFQRNADKGEQKLLQPLLPDPLLRLTMRTEHATGAVVL